MFVMFVSCGPAVVIVADEVLVTSHVAMSIGVGFS